MYTHTYTHTDLWTKRLSVISLDRQGPLVKSFINKVSQFFQCQQVCKGQIWRMRRKKKRKHSQCSHVWKNRFRNKVADQHSRQRRATRRMRHRCSSKVNPPFRCKCCNVRHHKDLANSTIKKKVWIFHRKSQIKCCKSWFFLHFVP